MEKHMVRPSVNVVVLKKSKVLLSRRLNTGWEDGKLCLPGGHIEGGETPRQAAIREIEEELGLKVKESRLSFCCVAARKSTVEYVAYEFIIELHSDEEPENAEPTLCAGHIWADPHELPADTIGDFAAIITKGYLGKQTYLELGYD
jgi:8-oxo-dGTP diphosphatase